MSSTATELDKDTTERLSPLYRVLIHNDDITTVDFVVMILKQVFALEEPRANAIMWEAHNTGVAHVVTEPLERAEFHVEQVHSLARGRGFPLTLTIEPED